MKFSEWVTNNKFGDKILITDNAKNVNRLKRKYNESGEMVLNLDGHSIVDLAKDILIESVANEGDFKKIKYVSASLGSLIIWNILKEDGSGKYSFVPKECLCFQTAQEIYRVITVIRSGRHTDQYDQDSSVAETQLKLLIDEFESKLLKDDLYDDVRIITEATEALKEKKITRDAEYGIFTYMKDYLTYIEKEFLNALSSEYIGIECDGSKPGKATYCKSYGQVNEIQKVIEDIEKEGLKFGEVNILYASTEYENIIRAALENKGIPCNMTSGHLILDAPYPALVSGIIDWVNSGYLYEEFKRVADNEIARFGTDYRFGNQCYIGWGLDRYRMFVDKMTTDRDNYLGLLLRSNKISADVYVDDATGEEETVIKACSDKYIKFISGICALFESIPEKDVAIGDLYRKIIAFIEKNTEENDQYGYQLDLLKAQYTLFDYSGNANTLEEALLFIKNQTGQIRLSDSENGNAVSVAKMGSVEILERPHQYLIGMSYDSFNSKAVDSPVLSDARLSEMLDGAEGYIEKSVEKTKVKSDKLLRSVATMDGGFLTVIGADYDTKNFRKSALSETYNMLKELYAPAKELSIGFPYHCDGARDYEINKEEFNNKVKQRKEALDAKALKEADNKSDSEEAKPTKHKKIREKNITTTTFNVTADGKTKECKKVVINSLSPSAIATMMECPWKYAYEREHFSADLPEKDINVWLQANDKGTLFHQVFEKYCNEKLINTLVQDSDSLDEEVFERIYAEAIDEFVILVPTGSEFAFEKEKEEMHDQTHEYLAGLYEELKKPDPRYGSRWTVKECEKELLSDTYIFNSKGELCDSAPTDDSFVSIRFHGFPDRIDECTDDQGNKHERIIDYKTGKMDNLKKKLGKTQIQYAVYPMVQGKQVEEFDYVFPCDGMNTLVCKGEEITVIPENFTTKFANVFINGVLDKPTDDACTFCDYKDMCGHKMILKKGNE